MTNDNDKEIDRQLEQWRTVLKERHQAETALIREKLEAWARPIPAIHGNALTYALLEYGMDLEIDLLGITDAREFILKIFDRRAEKHRKSLQ